MLNALYRWCGAQLWLLLQAFCSNSSTLLKQEQAGSILLRMTYNRQVPSLFPERFAFWMAPFRCIYLSCCHFILSTAAASRESLCWVMCSAHVPHVSPSSCTMDGLIKMHPSCLHVTVSALSTTSAYTVQYRQKCVCCIVACGSP